jgi:hypothetical protein
MTADANHGREPAELQSVLYQSVAMYVEVFKNVALKCTFQCH